MSALLLPGALTPRAAAAAPTQRVLSQALFDVRAMLRNGEQLLLTLVLPTLVLVALVKAHLGLGSDSGPDVVTPGVLALAVMSTSFTGQAIGTGFDRRYGVLRLLGTTPLGRAGLVAARVLAVLLVEVVQFVVLGGVGVALGWRPHLAGVPAAVVTVLLGTTALTALALLLAGTLRAEAVLAGANLLWVLLLAGGGVVVPARHLGAFAPVAHLLCSGALGDALRDSLGAGTWPWSAMAVLVVWAGVASAAAARFFRWS